MTRGDTMGTIKSSETNIVTAAVQANSPYLTKVEFDL